MNSAGKLTVVVVVPTHVGERNGVVTKNGTVYMAHARPGNFTGIVVVVPTRSNIVALGWRQTENTRGKFAAF